MPEASEREGVTWLRPWLGQPPDAIAAYVRRYRLRHIEDDSNAELRFARNRLRLDVWPALVAAFPQADSAFAATAAWANEARVCADALAAIDLAALADARGLDLPAWLRLQPERRSNALRSWLKTQTGSAVAATTVARLLAELPARAPAQWPLGGYVLRRYRGRLSCRVAAPANETAAKSATTLSILRAGTYAVPGWGGRLRVRRVSANGVALPCLAALRFVERTGGEQFQLAPERPARSLKKQFQAQAVPAWQRSGPLVYCGTTLIFVPGLGIDSRAVAGPGEPQMSLEWLGDAQ